MTNLQFARLVRPLAGYCHSLILTFAFVTAILALFYSPAALAQETCGDFVYLDPFDEDYVEAVDDCDNPFGTVDGDRFSNVVIQIDSQELGAGDMLTYEQLPVQLGATVSFDGDATLTNNGFELFYHSDGNYVSDYTLNVSATGTYTLVHSISEQPQLSYGPLQQLWEWLVPVVHAQFNFGPLERTAITFSVALAEPEPELTGASSVLFLPGIMGSKLYEQGQQCGDSGDEQQRWFSTSACEQLRLKTDFMGRTINDIYTKAEDDAVIDKIFISTLYDSFMQNMNDLEESGVIDDFVPFAYDWRLQLDDLLKMNKDPLTDGVRLDTSVEIENGYLYQTIQAMADTSLSGSVTIVAHSNGGLLAKTFMSALQAANDPLLQKIDNIVLVASPQVGTPDAVVGMLQGSEIGAGYIASQATTRQLLNTAPFGHHLLPNQNYFSGTGVRVLSPVVTFAPGASTDDWINAFGSEITDSKTLHQFLSKDSGRPKPQTDDLKHPEVVDNFLLNYADTIAAVVESWTPDPDTNVYQIAGTGLETVSGITYFTDKECIAGGFLWYECTEYVPKLGYYVNFTLDGDRTVVTPSALAMQEQANVQRLWLDLAKFENEVTSREHRNILEVPDVIDFIKNLIQSIDSTPAGYLSDKQISSESGERLSFFLLSPLDMYLESTAGITSSTTDEIPGATYRRYGEVQYVSVPADTAGVTLHLHGYKTGSFTLLVQKHDGEVIEEAFDFTAISTGTSTVVQLPLDGLSEDASLEIDFDGDGVVDGVVTSHTDSVSPVNIPVPENDVSEPLVVEERSTGQTTGTRVRPAVAPTTAGLVAGIAISADEQWYYKELQNILEDIAELLVLIEAQYGK